VNLILNFYFFQIWRLNFDDRKFEMVPNFEGHDGRIGWPAGRKKEQTQKVAVK
jgi:hypothetical protein